MTRAGPARHGVDALFASAYAELRRLARAHLRRGAREVALDTGTLVHEAYLRCAGAASLRLDDARRALAYASKAMRSVVVDAIRTARREGVPTTLPADDLPDRTPPSDGLRLAVAQLAEGQPRWARVVTLRWFEGLTEAQVAARLGVSERTVRRDWDRARLVLLDLLRE